MSRWYIGLRNHSMGTGDTAVSFVLLVKELYIVHL